MSSTMRNNCCDEALAVLSMSRWSGGSGARDSRSSMGTMPLSGVRISWLMVARNSPLASTADSAACLASSSSCSSWLWRCNSRFRLSRSDSAMELRASMPSIVDDRPRSPVNRKRQATAVTAKPASATQRPHGRSTPNNGNAMATTATSIAASASQQARGKRPTELIS